MTFRASSIRCGAIAAVLLITGCTVRTAESSSLDDAPAIDGTPTPTTSAASTTTAVPSTSSSTTTTTTTITTTTTSPAPTPTSTGSPPSSAITLPSATGWAATDTYLQRRILGGGSSAASFAVSIGGEIVHRFATGTRVIGSLDPVEPHDRFRIASISKTLTAITVLQLVEDGVVDLDEPVGGRVATMLGVAGHGTSDVTVRQLLTHTSGFPKYENLFFRNQAGSCREAATVGFGRALQGAPGGQYRYSNMNYCALGLLIEDLTGSTYEQAVYERLLTPLGLSGLRLAPTYDPGPDEVEHRSVPGRNYMEVLGAAGAWVATPSDLVTIMNSLEPTTPGWKPLDESTLAAMRTSAIDPLVPDRGYGMGLILYGGGAFGHTGTVESTRSMTVDRGDGVTWAVTVSGEYPGSTSDLGEIVDAALVAGGFVAGPPLVVEWP